MPKPKAIEITAEEADALIIRLDQKSLLDKDYDLIRTILESYLYLGQAYLETNISIKRLLAIIFGSRTESSKNILDPARKKKSETEDEHYPEKKEDPPVSSEQEKKRKGHGRNGAEEYIGAKKVSVPHESLKCGDPCPKCPKGKLCKLKEPGRVIRVTGRAPLEGTVYELERLRCNLCGYIFTASQPEDAKKDKYDAKASAMIALLKYGNGLPFYRLSQLEKNLGIPLPASTLWEIVENMANLDHIIYKTMINFAAQGELILNDDTVMKVLSLMKKPDDDKASSRSGIFTSGILSKVSEHKICLFFTGRNHAGENLQELLSKRESNLSAPIQMCDALSRNLPKEFNTILSNCLAHARRKFVDIYAAFPEECQNVILILGKVYKNDAIAKEQNMSAEERLFFHQKTSGPLMDELYAYLCKQFNDKLVEPNSSMGKAISYMQNHWEPLTLFLRVPGAIIDNNLCEQALKRVILHRKNALFFKTLHGAYIGDMFMSIIYTCHLNDINAFDYLSCITENHNLLTKAPEKWMPWNYNQMVAALTPKK